MKSAVEKLKFKSVQLHQRNTVDGKLVFPFRCGLVRTKGYSTILLDPTQVESKKSSQIQWPVPSINAEPVDIFLGEE